MDNLQSIIDFLESKGPYETKPRFRKELDDVGGKFVDGIAKQFGGFDERIKTIYIGKESRPKKPEEKLPNLTLFWNQQFAKTGFMYASSMGHIHPSYNTSTQEVYEFQGTGAMLLATKEQASLYVCQPQDKVSVPPDGIMTILNLSHQRLLTVDMANPNRNLSTKDIIRSRSGPMIAIFNLGDNPMTDECDFSDYQVPINIGGTVKIALNPNYPVFGIKEITNLEFNIDPVESSLYQALLKSVDDFKRFNITVIPASRRLSCQGSNDTIYDLEKGLIDLVLDHEKPVHKLLDIV